VLITTTPIELHKLLIS